MCCCLLYRLSWLNLFVSCYAFVFGLFVVAIMGYATHRWRLMPLLAQFIGMSFGGRHMLDRYARMYLLFVLCDLSARMCLFM